MKDCIRILFNGNKKEDVSKKNTVNIIEKKVGGFNGIHSNRNTTK